MKSLLILLFFLIIQTTACKKNNDSCSIVTITNSAPGCGGWGITVNGTKYPSANIPSQFQHDGQTVCATYDLYDDMRACSCCGGTWAQIKAMFSE
jgi:hypothetical protein